MDNMRRQTGRIPVIIHYWMAAEVALLHLLVARVWIPGGGFVRQLACSSEPFDKQLPRLCKPIDLDNGMRRTTRRISVCSVLMFVD